MNGTNGEKKNCVKQKKEVNDSWYLYYLILKIAGYTGSCMDSVIHFSTKMWKDGFFCGNARVESYNKFFA